MQGEIVMRLKYYKGQAITEFAIVIPLFLAFLLGILYLFIYCYNLIALQTMSRDIARARSVGISYSNIQDAYKSQSMPNLLMPDYYTWNYDDSTDFPEPQLTDTDVTVVIHATGSSSFLPTDISASISMYKEST